MFSQVQPYSFFLKAFDIFGFNYNRNSIKRNFLSVSMLIPVILYWSLALASILQVKNVEALTDRLLYIPAIAGTIFKAVNILAKLADFKKLMKDFNEAFKDEKLEKSLMVASRKSNLLLKLQFFVIGITSVLAFMSFYATRELMVPFYVVNIPNYENEVFWFNNCIQYYGVTYSLNILILCDLMPVCLMVALAEHCRFINESFRELSSTADFINCVKLHRKQHE